MKKSIMACFICCLMASAAFARDYNTRRLVIAGQISAYIPTNEFAELESKIGDIFTIDVQYFFNDYLGIGLYWSHITYSTEDVTIGTIDYVHNISSHSTGASLVVRLPLKKFDIYGLAGIGAAFSDYEEQYSQAGIDYIQHQDDTQLTYRFEGGIRYYVSDAFSLGLTGGYVIDEMDMAQGSTEKLNGFYAGLTGAVAL